MRDRARLVPALTAVVEDAGPRRMLHDGIAHFVGRCMGPVVPAGAPAAGGE